MKGGIFGGDGNDALTGGGSNDEIHGQGDQDALSGRSGDDMLFGGALGDTLKGGGDADDFVFKRISDSQGGSATTRDTILDFDGSEDDRIDFRPLDAKIGAGNQKFTFIGSGAFTGHKGELRYDTDSGNATIQADVTGDGKADMEILVNNVSKLSAQDFHL